MNEKQKENKREPSTANTTLQVENDDLKSEIIEVWEDNFEDEIDRISKLLHKYSNVAMDTEFPGVPFRADNLKGYNEIKTNVDALKLIQVGLSLSDDQGNAPHPVSTWQFNLKFDLNQEKCQQESIDMLKEAGINFVELAEKGIDPLYFAEYIYSSGLLLNEDVKWITFHGAFDFAYLIKVVTNSPLPPNLEKFSTTLKTYFPTLYDIKIMMKEVTDLKSGSLSKLARDLELKRIGTMHQAGSDSEITLRCFFKLKEYYFKTGISEKLTNKVYGLNSEYASLVSEVKVNPNSTQFDQPMTMSHHLTPQQPMNFFGFSQPEVSPLMYYNPVEYNNHMIYTHSNTWRMPDYSSY